MNPCPPLTIHIVHFSIVIDASGVVASGVAKGNYQFMGDFDECLDIEVKLDSNQLIGGFSGQYCTLEIPIEAVIGSQSNTSVNK